MTLMSNQGCQIVNAGQPRQTQTMEVLMMLDESIGQLEGACQELRNRLQDLISDRGDREKKDIGPVNANAYAGLPSRIQSQAIRINVLRGFVRDVLESLEI